MNWLSTDKEARRARAWRRKWADPTGVRQWHNPSDPVQAARIAAAVAKRERRATKYADSMSRAAFNNKAHGGIQFAHTLNPFYINY